MRPEIVIDNKIADKNDVFRKLGFGVTMTCGAAELPNVIGLMSRIRSYNDFTEASDPYHEHDFGKIEWHGEKRFFGRLITTIVQWTLGKIRFQRTVREC